MTNPSNTASWIIFAVAVVTVIVSVEFRQALTARDEEYMAGVTLDMSVWDADVTFVPPKRKPGPGRTTRCATSPRSTPATFHRRRKRTAARKPVDPITIS